RAHVWIAGRVQGVSFRAGTAREARRLGVAGWVRNLPDGRVEAVFEGPRARVDAALAWCATGTPEARVDQVTTVWESAVGDGADGGFTVRG
ncbi:MAG: acylphosphatase, partial [Myxococcota bacterium]